jgi:hypothetical protein
MNEAIPQPLAPPTRTFVRSFSAKDPGGIEYQINAYLASQPALTVSHMQFQPYLDNLWLRRFSALVVFEGPQP